jgi:hypothetical protein
MAFVLLAAADAAHACPLPCVGAQSDNPYLYVEVCP